MGFALAGCGARQDGGAHPFVVYDSICRAFICRARLDRTEPGACPYPGAMGRVLLARPRGYCAGVDRAVQTVERAIETYGAPIYVRRQIVHNLHVVRRLEELGAIFVQENDGVPEGAIVVFPARGVAPTVHESAARRELRTIDATCPLVAKV